MSAPPTVTPAPADDKDKQNNSFPGDTEERLRMSLLDGDTTINEESRAVIAMLDEEELELMKTLERRQERETELQMEEYVELQRVYGRTLRRAFRHLKRFPETRPGITRHCYGGEGEEEEEARATRCTVAEE